MAEVTDSILESVKEDIGVTSCDDAFDGTLIREINTAFFILCQVGVGPDIPFSITSSGNTWDEFSEKISEIEAVKSYVAKKVKISFDAGGGSSSALESDKAIASELEWRLNFAAECEDTHV